MQVKFKNESSAIAYNNKSTWAVGAMATVLNDVYGGYDNETKVIVFKTQHRLKNWRQQSTKMGI